MYFSRHFLSIHSYTLDVIGVMTRPNIPGRRRKGPRMGPSGPTCKASKRCPATLKSEALQIISLGTTCPRVVGNVVDESCRKNSTRTPDFSGAKPSTCQSQCWGLIYCVDLTKLCVFHKYSNVHLNKLEVTTEKSELERPFQFLFNFSCNPV